MITIQTTPVTNVKGHLALDLISHRELDGVREMFHWAETQGTFSLLGQTAYSLAKADHVFSPVYLAGLISKLKLAGSIQACSSTLLERIADVLDLCGWGHTEMTLRDIAEEKEKQEEKKKSSEKPFWRK